jgi:hypothetical protein
VKRFSDATADSRALLGLGPSFWGWIGEGMYLMLVTDRGTSVDKTCVSDLRFLGGYLSSSSVFLSLRE